MSDYPYIRKWGEMMGSHLSYIEDEIRRAKEGNAPANAVYEEWDSSGRTGRWATTDDITNPTTRKYLELE